MSGNLDEREFRERAIQALRKGLPTNFDAEFSKQRRSMAIAFTARHDRLLATTELFKVTLLASTVQGLDSHASLWNIGLQINVAAHDLSVLVWQLMDEQDPWARNLAARHLAITAYESTEDILNLLGKPMRDALSALSVLETHDAAIRSAKSPLDAFWRTHQRDLSDLRNTAIGHRDPNGLKLIGSIQAVDLGKSLELGRDLSDILNSLGQALFPILSSTSSIRTDS